MWRRRLGLLLSRRTLRACGWGIFEREVDIYGFEFTETKMPESVEVINYLNNHSKRTPSVDVKTSNIPSSSSRNQPITTIHLVRVLTERRIQERVAPTTIIHIPPKANTTRDNSYHTITPTPITHILISINTSPTCTPLPPTDLKSPAPVHPQLPIPTRRHPNAQTP